MIFNSPEKEKGFMGFPGASEWPLLKTGCWTRWTFGSIQQASNKTCFPTLYNYLVDCNTDRPSDPLHVWLPQASKHEEEYRESSLCYNPPISNKA